MDGGPPPPPPRRVSFSIFGLGICTTYDPYPAVGLVHHQGRAVLVPVEVSGGARARVAAERVLGVRVHEQRFYALDERDQVRAETPVLEQLRADVPSVVRGHDVGMEDGRQPLRDRVLDRIVTVDGHG